MKRRVEKGRREGPSSSKMEPRNINLDEMSTSEQSLSFIFHSFIE